MDRGDLKKSGSIEVANILSKKTKFVQSANIDDDLEKLRNKIENNEITVNDKDKTDLKENESKSENKK